ncbi:hypothetical protein [Streptomyces sp. NPDC015125]|uniref:hypothetical protein n=1 Tax=Streptomyces sp. NPDC015125 TaxID=3364938 RepID=UPI0036F59F52
MTSNMITLTPYRSVDLGHLEVAARFPARGPAASDEQEAFGKLLAYLRQDGDARARRGGRSAARTAQERREKVNGRLLAVAEHLGSRSPAEPMTDALLRLVVERFFGPADVEILLRLLPTARATPRGIYAARLRDLATTPTPVSATA